MIKVLIVDDDYLVRMYLRQLINWEKKGFEIIGDVCNGAEAIEFMNAWMPQLVITDISMPVMDGIELIRRIKENQMSVHIIVLSCHDEFEYVKEAMKLGADEYVLKNVLNESSLCKLLGTMRCSIEQSTKQQLRLHELQRLAQKGSDVLRQELIELVQQQQFSYEEQFQLTQKHGLDGRYYQCAALLIRVTGEARANAILQVCQQFIRDKKAEFIMRKDGCACILKDLTDITSLSEQRRTLQLFAIALANTLKEYTNTRPSIGISAVAAGDGSLTTALIQAETALSHGFYGDHLCYFDILPPLGEVLPLPAMELAEIFADIPCDVNACVALFREAIICMRSQRTEPALVKDWIAYLDEMIERDPPLMPPTNISECNERLPLYEAFWKNIGQDNILSSDNPRVAHAAAYIKQHFTEAISLNHVAEEVGLNPAYLSYLFKRETGVNFSDYLLSCRLEYAKQLLTSSKMTIKKVAANAGFLDYRHFCKMFKNDTGQRPTDYRRQS